MNNYEYEDNEVTIQMVYYVCKNPTSRCKGNVMIDIKARGDFKHHTIEGIVNALKVIQNDNPHLEEL